jgi:hypothetical protein
MTYSAAVQNRPFKFGAGDRREFIVQDSEVSLVAINDDNGNPIFLGRAKPGTPFSDPKWQIRKITYDTNEGVIRVEWPEDLLGAPSINYEFIWSSFQSPLMITGITQASTAVVTVSSIQDLQNGDLVAITGVSGMTEVNFNGSNLYTVANIAGNTFELQGVNSTTFSAYVSGGRVNFGQFLTYTYG